MTNKRNIKNYTSQVTEILRNHLIKPNEQSGACSNYAMAANGRMKSYENVKWLAISSQIPIMKGNFRAVRLDFVQRQPERPTRYQPRATPWVINGVDCALKGQKHHDIYSAFALSGR